MDPAELVYPVLSIARTGDMEVLPSALDLTTTNTLALKNGYYDKMALIDVAGSSCKVEAVISLGGIGPFGGFRFLKPRRIRVRLDVTFVKTLSVDEIRDLVLACMRRRPHSWNGLVRDVRSDVHAAKSISELFAALK